MIVDARALNLANAIERLLDDADEGEIHPELHESTLEIATRPCATVTEAGEELRALRLRARETAAVHGLTLASAGTHPFARWEDQRIVGRQRYRDLVGELGFVARQELIFGMHVHVAVDDPDKAVHVANGMRLHVPVLLALSANSPFWRSEPTGLLSARTPVFRQFPRVGIPPAYAGWEDYERQIGFMIETGVMADYTYLWYDVRPHPKLGTVEVRACDSQTRLEHTLGLTALIQAMVEELGRDFEAGGQLPEVTHQMLDENKWTAARDGLDAELVDLPSADRVTTRALTRRLLDRLRGHAQDLGAADALEGVEDILERGTGAERQLAVWGTNHDLGEVVAELVAATAPAPLPGRRPSAPPS